MKSLATTFLIFAACVGVAATIAIIDRADAALASTAEVMAHSSVTTAAGGSATLAEFAESAQETLRLTQPSYPVAFADIRPGDPGYAAAEAIYPFLHRQLLCPECMPTLNFSPRSSLTRAQSAIALVSILSTQQKISLLSPAEASEVLAELPDASALPIVARPYIATAIQDGILTLQAGNRIAPAQPDLRTDLTASLNAIQRRFTPSPARTILHPGNG